MQNGNTGVVYVATRKQHYIAEAFLSANSVKDFSPDLGVTLYTDIPESPLARADCFDNVISLETRRTYTSLWAEGQLDRIRSLVHSPYERTLHLDVDTRILTPEFIQLFDKLDSIDIAMVICQPDVSKCSQWTGLSMFNVGFILFRRNDKVIQLLEAWEDLTRRHFEMANMEVVPPVEYLEHIEDPERRRELLFMDQTSFVQLLSPDVNKFGVNLEILDEAWNFRGTGSGRKFEKPVKISHHPSLRARMGEDVIERVRRIQRAGNVDLAREIYQVLHDDLVPPENSQGKEYVMGLIRELGERGG